MCIDVSQYELLNSDLSNSKGFPIDLLGKLRPTKKRNTNPESDDKRLVIDAECTSLPISPKASKASE